MPRPAAAERVPERGDDPARVRVNDGEVVLGVLLVGGRHLLKPAVEVVRRDLPQDGVDEPGPPVAEHHPGEFHARRDRGVARDPRAEQLVRAEREHVEHRRVDLAQRPVDAGRDDRVVRALAAQRPVDEFGGERRVPGVEVPAVARLAQQRGQDQVGVGIPLVDGPQRLEGQDADRVLLGTAVGLCGLARAVVRAASDESFT